MIIGIDASRALRAQRTGTERYALEIIRHLLASPTAQHYQWRLYVDDMPAADYFGVVASQTHVTLRLLPRQRLWTHRVNSRRICSLSRPMSCPLLCQRGGEHPRRDSVSSRFMIWGIIAFQRHMIGFSASICR